MYIRVSLALLLAVGLALSQAEANGLLVSDVSRRGAGTAVHSEHIGLYAAWEDQDRYKECPSWYSPRVFPNGTSQCKCGSELDGRVKCFEEDGAQKAYLMVCSCIGTMEANGSTQELVSACPYNCFNEQPSTYSWPGYILIPQNRSELNQSEFLCGYFNRAGMMCSRCISDDLTPPVLSYNLSCIPCVNHWSNWIKYFAAALIPETVFFFIVFICRISVTSAELNAFVTVSQLISEPQFIRAVYIQGITDPTSVALFMHVIFAIYGVLNLDFFKTLLPTFCLYENMSVMAIMAIDYLTCFYPLVLLFVMYVCIELHANNFRPVVWVWRPFHYCFVRFRRQWNIGTSITDAFASFLLLSYYKFLAISFDLLKYSASYNMQGEPSGRKMYYDGEIEYFGKRHLPVGILAIFIILIFNVTPVVLLVLYPLGWFQRMLSRLGTCRGVHTFVDAFQGHYKNGTEGEGTRDCRYFSVAYLLLRIVLHLVAVFTRSITYYLVACALFITVAFLVLAFQPYKKEAFNMVDAVLLTSIVFLYFSVLNSSIHDPLVQWLAPVSILGVAVFALLPFFYLCGLFVLRYYRKFKDCIKKHRAVSEGADEHSSLLVPVPGVDRYVSADTDTIPHRMRYPKEYEERNTY